MTDGDKRALVEREALEYIANLADTRQADRSGTASAMAGNAFRKIAKRARNALAASEQPTKAVSEAEREILAADIARVAGCQVGSERTRRIVDYILARDALASQSVGEKGEGL